ncbi:hypothetical protein BDC45DRAFT_495195 [Circinella umbellata]|nr:hypothetical protein BDC45DRAFT_495195 [Circinella umbellata]
MEKHCFLFLLIVIYMWFIFCRREYLCNYYGRENKKSIKDLKTFIAFLYDIYIYKEQYNCTIEDRQKETH